MMSLTKVFVYGTLRRGQQNNFLLSEEHGVAHFLGTARLVNKYPMVIYTSRNVPCLLSAEGQGQNVVGDLYDVDSKMLTRLDVLEDHPNLYTRTLLDCVPSSGGTTVQAQVYMLHNYNKAMLTEPFLTDYIAEVGTKLCTYTTDGVPSYNVFNDIKEQN